MDEGKKAWRQLMQPDWYLDVARGIVTGLRGGYTEAVSWIGRKKIRGETGTSEHSMINRLRGEGDQIFPLGWTVLLDKVSGTHHFADAVAREYGGVFIPLPDIEEVDNADINQRLLEAVEELGIYSQKVRAAIEDGVIDRRERKEIDAELHRVIVKIQEHASLVLRVFCPPEKGDARECAAPGTVASSVLEKTNA
ncbi:hypothetical protein AABH71_004766 [Salmonella enterica]|nr:hypothetical protein [Salmonella enterica subsp. enterica serovar Dahomey]EAW9081357.1 hypothetical protein [Salmonella enterica]EBQ9003878.1 hypothetical protein [Salmonella enterica subsp. enterica serovar Blockley]ECW2122126.1 hypothetical protein [Salmonella enterica]